MAAIEREYVRSILFGVEDSLISTTGLIAGLTVGADDSQIIILGSLVAVVIEAVSMGVGEYLSDDALQDLDKIKRHRDNPLVSGGLMFGAYLVAGFIPLLPILVLALPRALLVSVGLALLSLFLLGYLKGRLLKSNPLRGALKILVVGGITTILGVVVGLAFRLN